MIFVDSSAWFAAMYPLDADHGTASKYLDTKDSSSLVTSEYVIDEVLTLLRARHQPHRALKAGELLVTGSLADVVHVTETDFQNTWKLFTQYHDKKWSFTDCSSLVLMRRLGIFRAFAFDHHFHQFDGIEVLPHLGEN